MMERKGFAQKDKDSRIIWLKIQLKNGTKQKLIISVNKITMEDW